MVKRKKSKAKPRRVVVEDLAVTDADGSVSYPHEGEFVTFRGGGQTVGDYLNGLELTMVQLDKVKAEDSGEDLTAQELATTRRATQLFEGSIDRMAESIVEWDWTDNNDQPYANPPTADVLKKLSFDELNWLGAGGRKKEAPLASESPSTSP